MESLVNVTSFSYVPFTIGYYVKITGYCYPLVNVINFGVAHIKWLLLNYHSLA